MEINIIAAMDKNGLIGNGNKIPWHLPADIEHFKKITTGYPVIMGSKTFNSLEGKYRPLPKRENIILSRSGNKSLKPFRDKGWEGTFLPSKIINLIKRYTDQEKIFNIGGREIYTLFLELELVDIIHLTEINGEFKGNVFFPTNFLEDFVVASRITKKKDAKNSHDMDFVVYEKK